jgi:hypothetical protein
MGNGGDEGEEYGWCAAYTYMKQNGETSCKCFKCGREEVARGREDGGGKLTNVQCKPI